MNAMPPGIELGHLLITPAAREALSSEDVSAALGRHVLGDWGEVCPDDWQANDAALELGARLFSAYRSSSGLEFWVITEADRSATTLMLPGDY